MKRQLGGKGKKNVDSSQISSIANAQPKSLSAKYPDVEVISQLKALAADPCCQPFARDNIQAFSNQIRKLRKMMALKDAEIPWRKRKLEQFVKDKLRPPSPFVSPTKKSRKRASNASPTSSLRNSSDSTKCGDEKITFHSRACSSLLTFEYSLIDDTVDFNCLRKDSHHVVDSDESVKGLHQPSPESFPNLENRNGIQSHHLPNGAHSRPLRLLNSASSNSPRKVIPVGPRFQTVVAAWTGPKNGPGDTDSKWLGTRVWPARNGDHADNKVIGKGRLDSCLCGSRESPDCIRRHVLEERRALEHDLGLVFSIWGFDEMGEAVSERWSLKEHNRFVSLLKMKPPSNGENFLKRAKKCFPDKSGKDIVSYYFNVYIPRRMGSNVGSKARKQVDTDDDEVEESNDMGVKKRKRYPIKRNSKGVKGKYLCRLN